MYRKFFKLIKLPRRTKHVSTMSAFIQKVNPLTGLDEWVVENDEYDYHQEVARAAFADMLHDQERSDMYEQALKVAIEHMHAKGKKANVLDIGTGTGLLSMMAVRHNADSVVACESFGPMTECAHAIIKLNNMKDKITIIPKRSTEIVVGTDMPNKANILVTEVFDTELIGEGALHTFQHAHQYLLEKDCIVVPHCATIYVHIIESPLLASWNRMKNIYSDEAELLLKVPDVISKCKSTSSLHDIQLSQLPLEYVMDFHDPIAIWNFDLSGKKKIELYETCIHNIESAHTGTAHGLFMWWDLKMDIDNKIILSCAPYWAHPVGVKNKIPWRDHWMQAVYYFPKELHVEMGSEISLICCHDDYSLWFEINDNCQLENPAIFSAPYCNCNLHFAYSRTRIGQLNDEKRNKKFLYIIEEYVCEDSVVLVLSQGFYAALIAAKIARKVYFLDTNHASRELTAMFIRENDLKNVEIIDGTTCALPEKANLVLAEPYYTTSIVPWDNLMFIHLLHQFKDSLCDNVRILPRRAIIKAMAMKFDNLNKIRAPLGHCNGFLMEPFDNMIERACEMTDDIVEAQPLWEYPGIALTPPVDVANINLQLFEQTTYDNQVTFDTKQRDDCNGIAIWIDWQFGSDEGSRSTITTGPIAPVELGEYVQWDMHSRQGVCLLGNYELPRVINYTFKARFEEEDSEIEFKPAPSV